MAGLNRRLRFAVVVLPLLVLTMAGWARAATITVTNTFDTGAGSLRAAIASANLTPTVASNITFSVSGTITLGSTLPAIANTPPGSLTIDGSGQSITISGGGTVQVMIVNGGATATVQNLTIAHGSSSFGGAIENVGTLTVNNCMFSGNNGSSAGGGIYNNVATLTVTNSTFSGNSSGDGGGIDNFNGTLTVTNSTFSNNSTTNFGGAILNTNSPGTAAITNCTFSGNHSPASAGAIGNFGTATLKGTVLAASTGGNCFNFLTLTDAGFNISDDGSCGFGGTSVNNSTTLNLDPTGLQSNGGPTKTIALEPNSQAVDFIPVADCTDQSSPTPMLLKQDQRGEPRPDPGNLNFCDAGAYELQTSQNFILSAEKIQVAFGTAPNSDKVNMGLTFTDTPSPTCDAADDVLRNGLRVQLFAGSCDNLMGSGLMLDLNPFAVHTVGGQSYGTLFQSDPPVTLQQMSETVTARIVTLETPGGSCGKWSLSLEVAGLNSAALGLSGNPFALILEDSDLHAFGCFDIDNAIVGNRLDPPRKVRRGIRR